MKHPSDAVYEFLGSLTANPDLARALLREIVGGTFVELDGKPCMVEGAAVASVQCEQMELA